VAGCGNSLLWAMGDITNIKANDRLVKISLGFSRMSLSF
jgi:hypothetical protein